MSNPGDVVAGPVQPSYNAPAVAYENPEQAAEIEGKEGSAEDYSGLVGYIKESWTRNKRARDQMTPRLLECLRARRAAYSPDEIALYSLGDVAPPYLPLAAMKMRAAEASLLELLLPENERAWGLDSSPIPKLEPAIELAVRTTSNEKAKQEMIQRAQNGQGSMSQEDFVFLAMQINDQMYDQKLDAERTIARQRAQRMEDKIEEHMIEGGYIVAMREFMTHFCTFPAAVLKGPYTRNKKKIVWGERDPKVVENATLEWAAVNPLDCYPAPQAKDCQTGDFIERMRFTRGQLYQMIGLPGYDEAAIRNVLEYQSQGNLAAWLAEDSVRRQIEGNTGDLWKPKYVVDALHYWGSVQGKDLIDHGVSEGIEDPLAYYEIDAILIGNELIRVEVNDDPLGRRPYRKASFDEVPGAFWGNSLYELMRDSQAMANAAFRALNANMGLASGPIMGVDLSKMAAGEDPKAIAPLQVVQLDTQRSSNQDASKALIFFQAEDRSEKLWAIIEACKKEADDLTGIPRYMYGDGQLSGGAATMGGLSMLMGAASRGLRKAVSTIDENVVSQTVYDAYVWEMLYGDDENIKGDCVVSPRGAAAVLVKEHLQATRVQFLQMTANPTDMGIIGVKGRAALLRQVAQVLDMNVDDIVPNESQIEQMMSAPKPPPQPTPDTQLKEQTKIQTTKMQTDSKERIAGAKVAETMAKENLLHPQKAEQFAEQQIKTELDKAAQAAYRGAQNPPIGFEQ